jgi:hypothetical protein
VCCPDDTRRVPCGLRYTKKKAAKCQKEEYMRTDDVNREAQEKMRELASDPELAPFIDSALDIPKVFPRYSAGAARSGSSCSVKTRP